MTKNQIEEFEFFLRECFKEDVCCKELRLSDEEVLYLKDKYPKAVIDRMPEGKCCDGKVWYRVSMLY